MNILEVNASDNKGGAAKVAWTLKEELRRLGHRVAIAVDHKYSNDPEIFRIKETLYWIKAISALLGRDLESAIKRRLSYWLANDIETFKASKLLESKAFQEADIVHLHNIHSNYFDLKTLEKISESKSVIWTLHDMWAITPHCAHAFGGELKDGFFQCPSLDIYPPIAWHNEEYLQNKKAETYNKSKFHIVVPSIWLKEKVEKSTLKDHPTSLIYNGVDTNKFRPQDKEASRKELGLPLNKKIILFLAKGGRTNPWKGWEYLEKIIQHFSSNPNIIFVALGGDSKERSEKIVNIPYTSSQEELVKFYSASDILLYPSLADNCPLVVLEAQACGLPVVSFRTGGIPEIIEHKKTGWIADYKNLDQLIAGVNYLIKISSEELKNISLNSTERISNNFSLEKMTREYLDLYQRQLKD
jgi:glycosyltransferase involved in cell wall biosynthesis